MTYKIKKNKGRVVTDIVHVSRLKAFYDRREFFGPLCEELPDELTNLDTPLVTDITEPEQDAAVVPLVVPAAQVERKLPAKHTRRIQKPRKIKNPVLLPAPQPAPVATRSGRTVRRPDHYGYANSMFGCPHTGVKQTSTRCQMLMWLQLLLVGVVAMLFWGIAGTSSQASNITQLCDCTTPITHGIVNLGPTHFCHENVVLEDVRISKQQKYALTVVNNVLHTIPAHACRQWRDVIQITGFFPWGHDTDRWKESVVVSPVECWAMVQTKLCGAAQMQQQQSTLTHVRRAEIEPAWARTTSVAELNCVVDVVELQRVCETCAVMGLHGFVAENAAAQQGRLGEFTYVWHSPKNQTEICDEHELLTSVGRLFKHANQMVLRDSKKQLDIVLSPSWGRFPACTRGMSYGYLGQANIRVYFLTTNGSNPSEYPFPPAARTTEELVQLHNQWLENQLVDAGDEQWQAINLVQCAVVTNRLALLQMLSVFSPLLAGELMGLKPCQGAQVIGSTAEIIQCRSITVIIDAAVSKCGMQPLINRYIDGNTIQLLPQGNLTIARDGYALVPYSPCLWHGDRIKANKVSLRYQLAHWQPETGMQHPVAGFIQHIASVTKYIPDADPAAGYARGASAAPDFMLTMLQKMSSAFAAEDVALRDVIKRADEIRNIYWPFINLRRLTTTM